jgi:hypothetical protein
MAGKAGFRKVRVKSYVKKYPTKLKTGRAPRKY